MVQLVAFLIVHHELTIY